MSHWSPNPTISRAERVEETLTNTPCAAHSLACLDQEPQEYILIQSTMEEIQRGFD
ncbi:hypothetical protein ACSS6W_005268 [Trichoderma asperelloides]